MKCQICRSNEGLFDVLTAGRKRVACGPCAEEIEDAEGAPLEEEEALEAVLEGDRLETPSLRGAP
jgi:hypothetical protein